MGFCYGQECRLSCRLELSLLLSVIEMVLEQGLDAWELGKAGVYVTNCVTLAVGSPSATMTSIHSTIPEALGRLNKGRRRLGSPRSRDSIVTFAIFSTYKVRGG
jgi:hypothetical protein